MWQEWGKHERHKAKRRIFAIIEAKRNNRLRQTAIGSGYHAKLANSMTETS
jgi:hypothetical protein